MTATNTLDQHEPDYRQLYFDLMRAYEKEVMRLEQIRDVIELYKTSPDNIANEIIQTLDEDDLYLDENDFYKNDDNNPPNALAKLLAAFSKIKGSRGNIQYFFDNYNMYMHNLAKTITTILRNKRDPKEMSEYNLEILDNNYGGDSKYYTTLVPKGREITYHPCLFSITFDENITIDDLHVLLAFIDRNEDVNDFSKNIPVELQLFVQAL